jgi:hypothetical protein
MVPLWQCVEIQCYGGDWVMLQHHIWELINTRMSVDCLLHDASICTYTPEPEG